MKDYGALIRNIEARQNPEKTLLIERKMFSSVASDTYDIQKYIKLAMNEVDDNYTQRSIEAGTRVKDHLQTKLLNIIYKYQGSVMTNTHIRGYSDIDLLTITDKFYSTEIIEVRNILNDAQKQVPYNYSQLRKLQQYNDNFYVYEGDSIQDLRNLRNDSERILSEVYDICDISGPKAIKITNQALHRDVDIVTACWYDVLCL